MKTEHAIALIALILGIIGGVLLLDSAIDVIARLLEGRGSFTIESPILVGIGIIMIIAGVLIWTGRYVAGGVINIVLGILTIFYGRNAEGIMVLISGVLGIMAPRIRD